MTEMQTDWITGQIVDAAFRLHVALGPGLLESVYATLLHRELDRRGLRVERERNLVFRYDGVVFTEGLRVDMLVEERIVVELKAIEKLAPVHKQQVLTYLRLLDLRVGLLINFGAPTFKEGIVRVVNNYNAPADRLPFALEASEAVPDSWPKRALSTIQPESKPGSEQQ